MRDFRNTELSLSVSSKETYAALYKQRLYVENAELEFQKEIDSLVDQLDKCSASLQTKEKDLDEIFKPDSRITPLAEKAFTFIYRQKVALCLCQQAPREANSSFKYPQDHVGVKHSIKQFSS